MNLPLSTVKLSGFAFGLRKFVRKSFKAIMHNPHYVSNANGNQTYSHS